MVAYRLMGYGDEVTSRLALTIDPFDDNGARGRRRDPQALVGRFAQEIWDEYKHQSKPPIDRSGYRSDQAFLFDDLPPSGAVPQFSRSECDLCVALEVRGGVGKEVVASARADPKRELDTMHHALHEKEWAY
ncbi:hypothetical protein Patl1_11587 [Pistacia atlantica]|uniref:Uncharacterized protein n=1 Tax=Pistacia atlantica TaxID=434234 RepID=A0ACC1A482_9ROSI|nr:hypothetical protein Patl1_11587 [Pistacia atlantica]